MKITNAIHDGHCGDKNCTKCRDIRKQASLKQKVPVTSVVTGPKPTKSVVSANEAPKIPLAIDFDGVLHDHKNPIDGKRMGSPIAGAKEAMQQLHQEYYLIVHSVWGAAGKSGAIEDWLKYYEIPYDEVTNQKPNAKYYIDDKAIRFYNWEQALADITP